MSYENNFFAVRSCLRHIASLYHFPPPCLFATFALQHILSFQFKVFLSLNLSSIVSSSLKPILSLLHANELSFESIVFIPLLPSSAVISKIAFFISHCHRLFFTFTFVLAYYASTSGASRHPRQRGTLHSILSYVLRLEPRVPQRCMVLILLFPDPHSVSYEKITYM
jgi:hypothetical protein